MDELFQELIHWLEQTLHCYEELLNLGKSKKQTLVANQVMELGLISQREEKITLQLTKMDSRRIQLTRQIAEQNGLIDKTVKLKAIEPFAAESYRSKLVAVRQNLQKTMEELAAVNELNSNLLQQAMKIVNFNINLLARTTTAPTYAAQGGQDAHSRTFIDRKA